MREGFKLFGLSVAWLLGIIALVVLAGAIFFGIRWVMAEPSGKLQARESIQSGPNRIAAYNLFFDRCAAVQTDEATIKALKGELSTGPSESRRDQINATLVALVGSRAEKINQYNADARKDYTIGQFRSSGLPFQLSIESEATVCTA